MRERFRKFMTGRYGNDELSTALLVIVAVLLVLGSVFRKLKTILFLLALIALCAVYFRTLSRDMSARRVENGKYLELRYKLLAELRMRKERWVQRKDYKFLKCPSCRAVLRVPRNKGKIRVVCRKCGDSFITKS